MLLELDHLQKDFGNNRVLEDITFSVNEGEFVIVLGASGAGKSTLLRCINGLCRSTEGRIMIDNMEVCKHNLSEIRKRVAFIFQNINVVGSLTVLQNVLVGRLNQKAWWNVFFTDEDREMALKAIERVGLKEKVHTRVDCLSGGQRQRVGIARSLVQNPSIILADEPISSLDPVSGREIMGLLSEINQEFGTIILCNLHQIEYVKHYGNRVLGIRSGRVAVDRPINKVDTSDLVDIYGSEFTSLEENA